jgi:hypothetical protein
MAPPTTAPIVMRIVSVRPPITVRVRGSRRRSVAPDELMESLLRMYV